MQYTTRDDRQYNTPFHDFNWICFGRTRSDFGLRDLKKRSFEPLQRCDNVKKLTKTNLYSR